MTTSDIEAVIARVSTLPLVLDHSDVLALTRHLRALTRHIDVITAERDEARAEVARLREALEQIAASSASRFKEFCSKPHDDEGLAGYWSDLAKERQELARAARAAPTEGDGK